MIRTPTPTGWLLTMQPAHALLSAQLAAAWGKADFPPPPRRTETLVAVSQHDTGWVEWEEAPTLTDEGEPRDFMHMPLAEHLANWRRGIAYARHQGPWAGLLVSVHATSLYVARTEEPPIAAFIAEQQSSQAAWRVAAAATEEEIEEAYALLRATDWLSLVLCLDHHRDRGEPVDLGLGPAATRFTLHWQAVDQAAVTPWPFATSPLDVHVESLELDQKRFASETLYRTALAEAPRIERRWRLEPKK
ncbi:MAG: DUF3891 family protein [Ardenticatenaceae bacterium]|nr:DUF3891 family protein [Ardenticatenaceae bacterium]